MERKVRLSPLQRQVLEQLAHIRVAPEDAWMTTPRLMQLTGAGAATLYPLQRRGLVESKYLDGEFVKRDGTRTNRYGPLWRITDKGREALG